MNSNANWRLQKKWYIHVGSSTATNVHTIGDVDNAGGYASVGAYEKSLPSTQFYSEPKKL